MADTILLSNKKERGLFRNFRVFQLVRTVFQRDNKVKWENVQDEEGRVLDKWRGNRRRAPAIIDSLPGMENALNEFERNLQLIYSETQKQGLKLILVNQAALYKDSMGSYESNLLWMGGKGNFQKVKGCAYYSPSA